MKTLYHSMSYMPLPSHGNHREAPTMYTCVYPQRAPSRCGGVMEKGVVTQPPTGSRMTCGGLTASLNNIIRLSTLPCVTPPVSLSGCIAGVYLPVRKKPLAYTQWNLKNKQCIPSCDATDTCILGQIGQYHRHWRPDNLPHQAIRNHDIGCTG